MTSGSRIRTASMPSPVSELMRRRSPDTSSVHGAVAGPGREVAQGRVLQLGRPRCPMTAGGRRSRRCRSHRRGWRRRRAGRPGRHRGPAGHGSASRAGPACRAGRPRSARPCVPTGRKAGRMTSRASAQSCSGESATDDDDSGRGDRARSRARSRRSGRGCPARGRGATMAARRRGLGQGRARRRSRLRTGHAPSVPPRCDHRPVQVGGRFSMKARIPSRWSSVAKSSKKAARSARRPALRVTGPRRQARNVWRHGPPAAASRRSCRRAPAPPRRSGRTGRPS